MLDPSNKDSNNLPLTIRAVFIIGPDKKLKLSLNYPASVGRNMDEIVRCVDALQLSANYSVVSPLMTITGLRVHLMLLHACRSSHALISFCRPLFGNMITKCESFCTTTCITVSSMVSVICTTQGSSRQHMSLHITGCS